MRTPSPPASSAGPRRPFDALRPIAGGLKLPEQHVDLINQSHLRCVALGVSRIERPDLSTLGRPDLNVARERNLRLYDHAAPVMELLHEQIVNSDSMVVLTDATGTVLHSVGDADFLGRASRVALAPGANWSEQAKGTNAVGTALIEEQPVLVHADEHYLHANHFLTCSAAPILDPRGNILGVLDVSGDHRSYHPHTMALVKMSARMIENRWLSDGDRNVMRLHFHSRIEFIGTLMEGILAVGADGRIVGANRGALEQLGLSGAALRMHTLGSLFGTSVAALADRFRNPLATPLCSHVLQGRPMYLLARFDWPAWSSTGGTPPAAARAAGTPDGAAGLAAVPSGTGLHMPTLDDLRTGDPAMAGVLDRVGRVIDRDIPIILSGETGTGKSVLARAIHAASSRSRQPFLALACAGLSAAGGAPQGPDLSSDLDAACKLLQVGGGTLFLHEVGELPLALQARLLGWLQGPLRAPASGGQVPAVGLAIVCSTQHRLRDLIDARLFREDLYQRLSGLTLSLPPLRERTDMPVLVRQILAGESGPGPRTLSSEVQHLLTLQAWPGNVRQLHTLLRTARALAGSDACIARHHLPDDLAVGLAEELPDARPAAPQRPQPDTTEGLPATGTMADLELDAIRLALAQCGGNISAASRRLGISRNTIYRRLGGR